MSHMPSLLSFLVASLLAALTTHCLPLTADDTRVTSGVPDRGSPLDSGMVKRDLSLNQDLKTLANMLIAREYQRIQQNHRNREFLRKIGKRGLDAMNKVAVADDGSYVTDLVPTDPLELLWPGFKCTDCGEGEKYGRNDVSEPVSLLRLLMSQ